MKPVLFRIGPLKIYSYSAMLYAGFVSGIAVGNYAANRAGLNSLRVFTAMLLLIVPSLLGARLLHVVIRWKTYRHRRREMWRTGRTGAAMFGGLPPILLLSVPLLGMLQIPFGAFWDVATFTMLVGLAFARIGCLLNGCCSGRPTASRLGLMLPDDRGVWRQRIPYQLIELALALIFLVMAALSWKHLPFEGALFALVLGAYCAFRSIADGARDQANRPVQDIVVHRLMPASISGLCAIVMMFASR